MAASKELSDLSLVRQANIKQLKADMEIKKNTDFADALGVKRGTLAQVMRDPLTNNIGNKTCETIYENIDLPAGWLDVDHSGNGQSKVIANTIQRYITLKDEGDGLMLTNFPITKYERDAIMKLLFVDKR